MNIKINLADLSSADLRGADLRGADLSSANLSSANLSGANLCGAKNAELALAMTSHLPEGTLSAWKKCQNGVLVKLQIPEGAKRSHGAGRKCRAEYALVLAVEGADEGVSMYDPSVVYRVGNTVRSHEWCENRWEECAGGIHFFITKEEAKAFVM
jgi:hypothetical protein